MYIQSLGRASVAALTLVLIVALAAMLATSGRAADPTSRTIVFQEIEKGGTFEHVRNTRPTSRYANLAGDIIVFANRLQDASGAAAGRIEGTCVTSKGSNDFRKSRMNCQASYLLKDGTISVLGSISPGEEESGDASVVGGTGSYANVRGTLVSTPTRVGDRDTLTLVN
ncbi:MAG: dirigent protein [Thermoleophilaceae bacterium]|nr:dirigent protein [Thermoleophilaceae bacterium]